MALYLLLVFLSLHILAVIYLLGFVILILYVTYANQGLHSEKVNGPEAAEVLNTNITRQTWIQRVITRLKVNPEWRNQLSLWWLETLDEVFDRRIKIEPVARSKTLHQQVKDEDLVVNLLPDVRSFTIKLRSLDWFLNLFGITRRHTPLIKIEKLGMRNRAMNRYVVHQFRRIKNHPKGWEIGRILIKRSRSYRLLALKHVFPNWHKDLTLGGVFSLLKKVERLCLKESSQMEFSRAYVDKPDGTARPLGVPKPEWRIYLHMWQNVITQRVKPEISRHQHGFLPGRGVITAWKDIFENVIHRENIFEYDLKGFFDNVKLKAIEQFLLDIGCPYGIVEWLHLLNRATPEFDRVKKIRRNEWAFLQERVNRPDGVTDEEIAQMLYEEARDFEGTIWDKFEHISMVADEILGISEEMEANIGLTPQSERRGVPQGSPTSPILAICALDPLLVPLSTMTAPSVGHVQYADDGLGYCDGDPFLCVPQPTKFMLEHGIHIHEKKSGFVKLQGKWLKPLKFLGMEYDGNTNKFQARTRRGATLVLDEARKDLLKFDNWMMKNLPNLRLEGSAKGLETKLSMETRLNNLTPSWRDLFTSRFTGHLFSRMQIDDWNINMQQDFSLDRGNKGKSWLDTVLTQRLYGGRFSYFKFLSSEHRKYVIAKLPDIGRVKLTTFNCSSFAINDLARRMEKKRR